MLCVWHLADTQQRSVLFPLPMPPKWTYLLNEHLLHVTVLQNNVLTKHASTCTRSRLLGERMMYIQEAQQLGAPGSLRVEDHLLLFSLISPSAEITCS